MGRDAKLACNCPSWIYGKGRSCKHLGENRDVLDRLAVEAIQREMAEHVLRQRAVIDDLARRETKRLPRAVQLELL